VKPIINAVLVGLFAAASGLAQAAPAKFDAVDANGDGSVDTEEFVKATESGVKKSFADLDKDGDGKLSKKEYSVVLEADCE
jgi:Ca2+-binding EF-hand superfamily protein